MLSGVLGAARASRHGQFMLFYYFTSDGMASTGVEVPVLCDGKISRRERCNCVSHATYDGELGEENQEQRAEV